MALYSIGDLDTREEALKRMKEFGYVKENLYPN
jgi:hypothetical protein